MEIATSDDGMALAVHLHQEGAFERLVEHFEKPLFNYVQKLLQNSHDSQEVVQDTFMRAHQALTKQYDAERSKTLVLRPWLYRIARNLSHNKRRGKRLQIEEPLPAFETKDFQAQVHDVSVLCRIEQKEELERLSKSIAVLPDESRELLFLRFIEEMSYAEIAKTTGHGEASLRGKVFRSLKQLREVLSGEEVSNAM